MGIRAQLLGLVAAAVLPFLVLIGAGLWNQSRIERTASSRPRSTTISAISKIS